MNTLQQNTQHSPFTLSIDDQQIASLIVNVTDKKRNTLSAEFVDQMLQLLNNLPKETKGLIFYSSKKNNFIQGFDLNSLMGKSDNELEAFLDKIHRLMETIRQLPFPTVAAIHGSCFGLGLELALAFQYRIASDDINTQFAMPQVRSGIVPFADAISALVSHVGLKKALSILLSGDKFDVHTMQSLNCIDDVVPQSLLLPTAFEFFSKKTLVAKTLSKTAKLWQQIQGYWHNNPLFRHILFDAAENKEWLGPIDNYPAMAKIIEILKQPTHPLRLEVERQAFISLFNSDNSKVLRSLEQTKRAMRLQYEARGNNVRDVNKLAIIGGGFMGAGIAYITVRNAKIPVRIKDIHPSGISKALHLTHSLLQQEVGKKLLSSGEMQQLMYLISGGERFLAAPDADFVIEAVYEDLATKQQVLEESEVFYSEHTIFATNTSTLSIADIASVANRPENVIGFHYFSPISNRKMLEIIPHPETSEKTIATAIHFAIQQGKIPLLVSDKPGFFVNRILIPYLLEAFYCLCDGEAVDFIDRALQEFGFEIGPLAMLDDFGLDLFAKMLPSLERHYGMRFAVPAKLGNLIRDQRKGSKNRRGFYLYHSQNGQRSMVDKSIYYVMETISENNLESEQVVRRCILMMINEAARCLEEGVINDPNEGNMASVLGVFFPEFRGGIYAYIEHIGAISIVKALNDHVKLYGERFLPCDWLLNKAEQEQQLMQR
ncbi:3-hydroxyacyl-CoA dehydrogenase NAD-binding domain-containing protein [Gallibacterium anatis]|uniref:3-hydroxyacyl-CoA dehydrogenase NAD-binding domain-containing protein n=1 Tax=Gallibacterium anatis TaxID=750 RepID=UPI000531A5C4|nr:3-hydroxyacyl-CoA dehydrogenase NAD-binding domain-containing protein [Gallibacterium anatis]KGQ29146.1 fatty-acid oxidation protein subunit alpha [Gallibacterium anatis]